MAEPAGPPQELTFGQYFAGKLRKLGEQHAATVAGAHGGIFAGVSVWLDGRLDPPEDVLKLLLVQNGGTIQHVLTATHVTHIIASNLPDSKIKEIRSHKVWRPVVRPAWVVESVRAGRLLPTKAFLLEAFAAGATLEFGGAAAPPPRAAQRPAPGSVVRITEGAAPNDSGVPVARAAPPPPPLPLLSAGADPRFLRRYNATSRLHYLGTARAERQAQVAAAILRRAAEGHAAAPLPDGHPDRAVEDAPLAVEPGVEEPPLPWPRVIAHVDIDCFFAQVGC